MFPLNDEVDPKLRNQILQYHMSDVMTDIERAQFFGLPEGCRMRERAKILVPENFVCGKYVWIGEGAVLDAQGGLTIGDYTQVGLNVMVWSHTSFKQALLSQTCTSKKGISYKATKIGNNCFIAGPSVIGPGVTIGNRVIISPLSFIDKDIPDDTVVSSHKEMKNLQSRVQELEGIVAKLVALLGAQQNFQSAEMQELLARFQAASAASIE